MKYRLAKKLFSIRLDPFLITKLSHLAKQNNVTLSEYVREILKAHADKR